VNKEVSYVVSAKGVGVALLCSQALGRAFNAGKANSPAPVSFNQKLKSL